MDNERIRNSERNYLFLNNIGNCKVWRTNAGNFNKGSRHIAGLPAGYPDISGFRKSDGKAVFIEVKTPSGKLRGVQDDFSEEISKYNVIYGVARSVEEAAEIIGGA